MYNPLTDEEIKNNIQASFLKVIEDKSGTELAIKFLMNTKIKTIGDLTMQEVDVIRESFGINATRTPKTLELIGQKYNLSRERVRQINAKAHHKLLRKIKYYNLAFMLEDLNLSDDAKEFLFFTYSNYDDLYIILKSTSNSNEPSVLKEIRDAFNNLTDESIVRTRIPIENCDFSVETYRRLIGAGIDTVEQLIIKFNDQSLSQIPRLGRIHCKEIENYLFKIYNVEKIKDETNASEKQKDESDLIIERIEKKEELLKKHKKVSDEKELMLEKEKQLDDELKNIMRKIKNSYMVNKNDRTKK